MKPPKITDTATAKVRGPWPFPIVIRDGKVHRVIAPRAPKPSVAVLPDALF